MMAALLLRATSSSFLRAIWNSGVEVNDPEAQKRVLEFFDQRFDLEIDFSDLDKEIRQQNQIIAEVRNGFPDIDESIRRLESNLRLSEEETQKLVKEMEKFLRKKGG